VAIIVLANSISALDPAMIWLSPRYISNDGKYNNSSCQNAQSPPAITFGVLRTYASLGPAKGRHGPFANLLNLRNIADVKLITLIAIVREDFSAARGVWSEISTGAGSRSGGPSFTWTQKAQCGYSAASIRKTF
jgi:hypothetical protein